MLPRQNILLEPQEILGLYLPIAAVVLLVGGGQPDGGNT